MYKLHHRPSSGVRRLLLLGLILLLLIVGGIVAARHVYDRDLAAVSNDQRTQVVTIKSGSTSSEIGNQLAAAGLIRSAWAFELYIHSQDLGSKLQAGTYAFSPSESLSAIVRTLTKGSVATRLVTVLPGRRIDQIRADFINDGFRPDAVDAALDPAQYASVPVVADKPASVNTLEGLLYPDSFQRTTDTDPSFIVHESLIEMSQHLTPDMQAAFAAQGLSTYQAITLASIVEQEVSKPADRPQVAQVFLSRLHSDATQGLLGSDITLLYARTMSKLKPGTDYSAYDTTTHAGLPPGPISTVSDSSLQAVAHPAVTNWLYFVSGDDGNTYFSTNLQDHQALTQKYCHKLCSQ